MINSNEYNSYYQPYIDYATNSSILEGLSINLKDVVAFFETISEEKQEYAYAKGKWTIKDILLHLIDTERIFSYRALRISRNDKLPLQGFEQDDYVLNGYANNRSMENLIKEYIAVRKSTIALYKSFNTDALLKIGEASGFPISVRALGYIITGHENHHVSVIKKRYL
ncbi:DinB family protein [Winogradskyella endarachnes]|uniref:DinB family protein n=1 Tax=Winogradskyella endarachnes TaxID=2681965 RepID=A0A6L6U8K0_9FLAO|nr:DinB family protein [Winogradskyella endarachnes]MUU77202.1 DinB family protein [Winogradskyella endarachnes]